MASLLRILRRRGLDVALLAALAGLFLWQLFLPGFIGLADNGDFPKVAGWLSLGPRGGPTRFAYFQPDYIRSVRNFWDAPFRSSETVLGWVARQLAGATHEGAPFDIRWLGGIHVAMCLGAFAVLLAALRGRPWWVRAAIAAVPLPLFTDVCYAAVLNSFYMDAVALCSLLAMTALAVWAGVRDTPSPGQLGLFFVAALLFVTSKAQHAVWALVPALFLVAAGLRLKPRLPRVAALAMAAVVFAAGAWMVGTAGRDYKGQAMFNLLFFRIGAEGPRAMPELLRLDVLPAEARYLGMHSYVQGSPMEDPRWAAQFYERTGFAKLVGWYLRHPAKTARMVADGIAREPDPMRSYNLSNYRVEDGHPPAARTWRWAWWSGLRAWLFHHAPWHLAVWYALFCAGCTAVLAGRASPAAQRMAWLSLGVVLLAAGEFAVANLADCLDVGRHLFVFHACTDLTVCFAAAWVVERLGGADRRRSVGVPRPSATLKACSCAPSATAP
jgi:hypothetical protein